jgi:phosphoglycolate phosphatase-like HAD superfamily hydrolase
MPEPLLVLFDIDGTLLIDDAYAHGRAMLTAMRTVYGVDPPDDAVERVGPWGKTDLRIAREALHGEGLDDRRIDEGLADWVEAAGDAFVAEAAASSGAWRVRPGLLPALKQLAGAGVRRTLLTGNLRAVATTKVERMGLATELDLAIGAYGDDAEERTELVPIARRRAGGGARAWPRARTAVVGDTPLDIAAAKADAVASVVFSSERYPRDALVSAEAVASDVEGLVETLTAWQRDGVPV